MSDEILRNTQAHLGVTFYAAGSATSADGAVVVSVQGESGTVVSAGTATAAGTAQPGVYSWVLAPQSNLDELTITWTGDFGGVAQSIQTQAEVVGGQYVTLADIRALPDLSSTSTYPILRLAEVRSWFADKVETFTGLSFIPRHERDVLDGDGSPSIVLSQRRPRLIRSASIDGQAQTTTDWRLLQSGVVIREDGGTFTSGTQNVVIEYEYGLDAPPPALREAALVAIRAKLLGDQSGIPDRAVAMNTEVGTFQLSLAGPNRPFGIPEVDAVVASIGKKAPLLA